MKNFKAIILGTAAISVSMLSSAETYLMDFNTFQSSGGYVGSNWNTYATPGDVTGAIQDNTGSILAGVSLEVTGDLGDTTHSGYFTNATGGAAWATTDGSLGNTQAVGDYFDSNSTGSPAIFTFGGLTAGDTVSLDIFASSTANSDSPRGYYSYSLDQGATYFGFDVVEKDGTVFVAGGAGQNYFNAFSYGNTDARYMNISSLTVGASGNVQVKVLQDPGFGRYAVVSAMQLTVIPEPSTFALLIAAGMGLLLTRRRLRR